MSKIFLSVKLQSWDLVTAAAALKSETRAKTLPYVYLTALAVLHIFLFICQCTLHLQANKTQFQGVLLDATIDLYYLPITNHLLIQN